MGCGGSQLSRQEEAGSCRGHQPPRPDRQLTTTTDLADGVGGGAEEYTARPGAGFPPLGPDAAAKKEPSPGQVNQVGVNADCASHTGAAAAMALREVVARLLEPQYDIAGRDFAGKRVLLRADFNVPTNDAGVVTDESRISAVLPTLRQLLDGGARLVLASHSGRPEPKKQSMAEMRALYSLAPVAEVLRRELGEAAFMGLAPDCVGPEAEAAVAALGNGQASMAAPAIVVANCSGR